MMKSLYRIKHTTGRKTLLVIIITLLGGAWILASPARTSAQTDSDTWTPPLNLSRSGGTLNPNLVVDSTGAVHVIWTDEFAGSFYTRGESGEWSVPDVVAFPFDGFLPDLAIDGSDRAHAFWIEDDQQLRYSRANIGNFGASNGWTGVQILGRSAIQSVVRLDTQDRIHLLYLRVEDTGEFPAGVYYRRTEDGGVSWSPSELLYASPYLRVLTSADANLSLWTINTDGEDQLYAAWDNRPQKRLLFRRSGDGGRTWDEQTEVVLSTSTSSAVLPFSVKVAAVPGQIVLVWHSGFPGGNCSQLYQVSQDNGLTWSEPRRMLEEILVSNCPTENRFFTNPDGQLFLWTRFLNQVFWQAWDGSRWSQARLQPSLSDFNDPDTLNLVTYRCQQLGIDQSGRLHVVGCDEPTGGVSGGDIWHTSIQLGRTDAWFPPPSAWQTPQRISVGMSIMSNPILLADQQGIFHAIWSQPDPAVEENENQLESSIYYSQLENGAWSDPALVVKAGSGRTGVPAAAIDRTDRIHIIFTDEKTGELYYSWAESARAVNSTEWNSPTLLFSSNPVGRKLALTADEEGLLFAVFTVPVNEQRGVYLLRSDDNGETWSAPILAFNGEGAGWEVVEQPRMATTTGGNIHMLVTRATIVQVDFPPNLYYIRSADNGLTWTDPEIVGDHNSTWSQILGVGDRFIHRIWIIETGDQSLLAHEFSQDNALTWTRLPDLASLVEKGSAADLVFDRNNQVHLLQINEDLSGRLSLNHRLWDFDNWRSLEELDLRFESIGLVRSISGAITNQGKIGALFTAEVREFQGEIQEVIFFTSSEIVLAGEAPTPLPPLPPTPIPIESATPPELAPTATTPIFLPQNPGSPVSTANQWIGAIVGAVLSGVIVVVVIFFGIRQRARKG